MSDLPIPASPDEYWLTEQVELVSSGLADAHGAVVEIAENWTEGRNVSRFHPGVSAADYIIGALGGPLRLGKAERNDLIVGLLGAGLSQRQVAEVSGSSRTTVQTQVAQSDPPALVSGADGKRYARRPKPVVVIEPKNVTPAAPTQPSSDPAAVRVIPLYQTVLSIRMIHQSEIADPLPDADLADALAAMPKVHKVLQAVEQRWHLRLLALHPERSKKPVETASRPFFDDGVSFGHSRPAPKSAEKPTPKSRFGR